MKVRYVCTAVIVLTCICGCFGAGAESQSQSGPSAQSTPKQEPTPEQIIQNFTQKETEFYEAWMQYTYTQTASIRVLSVDGRPPEKKESMVIISEVVFNDDGTREVRTIRRSGRLRSVGYTDEDKDVMDNINPFALTEEERPLYDLKYEGKEKVDELVCYVFSVKPKSTKKGKLYFEGKIWVDDEDLQVVRTVGKPVPQSRDNKFPEFETLRQMIDNKYWFPVWTHADSDLRFPNNTVRIEETITYDNYRKFGSDATIKFGTPSPSDER
jgi:hypothetical protein